MTPHRTSPRGFTLVELMASMAVGMIVLLIAVSVLGSTGDGYERVGGGVGAEREARALITQLTADLATARFNKDTVFEKSSANWPTDRLAFLTLQPSDAQSDTGRIGDLCAVNYYIKDLQIGNKTVRCLMRGFRESEETFQALRNGKLDTLFTPLDRDEPVAFDVLSFEARPKSRGTSGNIDDWQKSDDQGPQILDVKLIVARRELAGKLNTTSDWDGAGKTALLLGQPAEALRNRNLEAYGTLIRFGNSHETP